jgi:hypothetical protein
MIKLISLAGMLGVLVIAYALERGFEVLRATATRSFNVTALIWAKGGANLLFAGLMLTLAWWVGIRSGRSRRLAVLYLVAGLLLVFAQAIVGIVVSRWVEVWLPFNLSYWAANSWPARTGAFMAVIGMFNLIRRGASGTPGNSQEAGGPARRD